MAVTKRLGRFSAQAYHSGGVREYVGTFDTRSEAEAAVEEARAKGAAQRSGETVAEFALRWPYDYAKVNGKSRWTQNTVDSIRYALRPFIMEFGGHPLDAFPEHEAFLWANAQPPSRVKVVRTMYNDAVRSKLAPSNPFAGLRLPQSKGRSQIEAITEEELDLLGRVARDVWGPYGSVISALVIFQGTVGTRPIALEHLRADDVDLEAGTVYLRHPGKNVKPRTVLLPPTAIHGLREGGNDRRSREAPVRSGPSLSESDWLFTSITGRRLNKSSIFYGWSPVRDAFESALPSRRAQALRDSRPDGGPMELHELRHCAATSMRRRGATWEQIAHQLCQTDGGVQARTTYSHLTEVDHLTALREVFA